MDRQLINYLPNVLRQVREYQVLLIDGEQPNVAELWDAVGDVFDDQFLDTATVVGVRRLEKLLEITPKGAASLESRKFEILMRLLGQLPFTMRRLAEILDVACGKDNYALNLNEFELTLTIASISPTGAEGVFQLLRRICPANLVLTLATASGAPAQIYVSAAAAHTSIFTSYSSIDIS